MIRLAYLLLPVALITLSGCASSKGFDRAEMQEVMRRTLNLTPQQTAPGVTERPAPPLATPFRLGLFFPRQEFPTRRAIQRIEWLSRDKDVLLHALAPLQDQHILRDSIVIADSTVQNSTLTEIRKAAARYEADVIMIVSGVGAVDRYNNGYAMLYPTIIGAYLAPGTVSDALFMIEGSLWDVRSGELIDQQTAEGHGQTIGPAAFVEDRDTLIHATQAALSEFGTRLLDRLRRLSQTQPRATHSQP